MLHSLYRSCLIAGAEWPPGRLVKMTPTDVPSDSDRDSDTDADADTGPEI